MAAPANTSHIWRFGLYEVDGRAEELRRGGVPLKVREQSFRILVLLLEHPGELVTREDLRKTLWPADTYVDFDHGLNSAVMKLREALGERADKPLYIETVPRRGYRFIAPLAPASEIYEPTNSAPPTVQSESRYRRGFFICLILACVAAMWVFLRPVPALHIKDYVQLTHDGIYKEVAATDSNRIYINLLNPDTVVQVPLSGGEYAPIAISVPGEERAVPGRAWGDYPFVYDLSPDGSTFLCAGPTYSLWTVSITGAPIRQLATAESAAWSPDGKLVAYTWLGNIYLIRADGTDLRLFVPAKAFPGPPQFSSDLSWSPDGNRIRFTHNHELWEVSLSDARPHPLLPGWRVSSWKSYGQWTRDGAYFVFVTGEPNLHPLIGGDQIWALDERRTFMSSLLGSGKREPIQLTSGPTYWSRAVFSRDGRTIFARGSVLHGELQRYDLHGHVWRPYLGGKSVEFVTFSPDRHSVAYVAFPEEVLYRAHLDGKAPQQLTEPPLAVKSAAWSPDGSQILVTGQIGNGNFEMYLVPAQGGPPRRLIPDDNESEGDPQWSPDGKRVVYFNIGPSGDAWGAVQPTELRIFDLISKKAISLPGSGNEFSTRWSPDGRSIAVLTVDEHKLKVFDLLSRRWTTLREGITNYPTWSSDSKFIYFVDQGTAMGRVPVAGGKSEIIASLEDMPGTGSLGGWFGLDPDDSPLLLRDKGTNEIYALSLDRR